MIKIVAESVKRRSKTVFVVKAVDGDTIVDEKTATTINKRDELIWGFAEQFNTTDIVIIDPDKKVKGRPRTTKGKRSFKFSEIPSIPVLDMQDASEFFDEHEDVVYNRVIVAVKEGIESERDVIRLFELNGTGVYITSDKVDWKPGVENAEKFFAEREEYEKCAVCRDLLKLL
jgi:hypothetical protein